MTQTPPRNQLPPPRQDKPLERRRGPILRFTPTAWAKLQYFCHRGSTEIGGFAIAPAEDLLLVEDFLTVRQGASVASVAFDDAAVADFFEAQMDAGRRPEQFARIWLHTHPGQSPTPSSVDEETFDRVFGACDWAILFVLARSGATYARLRFNVGPGGAAVIPVEVDFGVRFGAADPEAWEAEYQANIDSWAAQKAGPMDYAGAPDVPGVSGVPGVPEDLLADLQAMEPAERRRVLDELAARPELWADDDDTILG